MQHAPRKTTASKVMLYTYTQCPDCFKLAKITLSHQITTHVATGCLKHQHGNCKGSAKLAAQNSTTVPAKKPSQKQQFQAAAAAIALGYGVQPPSQWNTDAPSVMKCEED